MITDTTIRSGEETLTTEDESPEGIRHLRGQISKLSVKNEQYKQELHELNRKLEISRNMEAELTEFHRTLEQSLDQQRAQADRKIHDIEEKHMGKEKELQDKLAEMEGDLAKLTEENKALRNDIKVSSEKLAAHNQSQLTANWDDNTDLLKSQIEQLTELLSQEGDVRRQHEETIRAMETELNEMKEILAATKKQLAETNEATESMRQELFECRMELESLKAVPAAEKAKGNSLFAEVEDRRRMTLGQMNAMRNSYLEAKRSFQAKEAEIKALKAERSLLLRKWEDDTVEKIQQDASLVDKYKARIGELEARLKDEQKKNKQFTKSQQLPENNFTFLQSLVDSKTKQIEELAAKLENDSLNALLDEEKKHKMGKQLRHWRYRAMSVEAELLMIKERLESDPSSSKAEILEAIKKRLSEKNIESNETFKNESTLRESTFVNETVVTLDSLMSIPICRKDRPLSEESNKIDKMPDHLETSKNNSDLSMEETAVICSNIKPYKSSKEESPVSNVRSVLPMEETAVISSHISACKPSRKESMETDFGSVLPMEETAVIHSHTSTHRPTREESVEADFGSVSPMEETAVICSHISAYKPRREESVETDFGSVLPIEETAVIHSHISAYKPRREESVETDFGSVLPMEETAVIHSHMSAYKPCREESVETDFGSVLPMEETAVIHSHISAHKPRREESVETDFGSVLPMEETAVIHSHISAYKPRREESVETDFGSVLPMEETAVIHSHMSAYKPCREESVETDFGSVLPMEETAVIRSHISAYKPRREESVETDFGSVLPMEETAVIHSHMSAYKPHREESVETDFGSVLPMEETAVIRSHISTYKPSEEESVTRDFRRMDDSMEIEQDTNKPGPKSALSENDYENKKTLIPNGAVTRPALKSMLSKNNVVADSIFASSEKNEKEKKTLRFAADTIDPPNKTLKKHSTAAPKYPIVFISSNKSKK